MPLRLGLVTGEYPPMQGGVGAFTRELAQALAALGHTIHVITSTDAAVRHDSSHWRDLVEPVDAGYALIHPRVRRWRYPSLATIVDLSQRYELDLVNVQYQAAAYNMRSPAINLLPWRMKGLLVTVVTFHDLRVPYLFPKAGRWRRKAIDFMARRAAGVIATNEADYHALAIPLADPDRLVKIPIGSNILPHAAATDRTDSVRSKLGLSHSDRLIGYFGFLNESKGADSLLRALAALDQHFHLLFIGGEFGSSDPRNNQQFSQGIRQLASELGLGERVHWTGFVPETEVSAYLYAVEQMVMPYRDGASLRRGTIMAALAHGRPLITTQPALPTPELIHGDNVHFVAPEDSVALAQAIRRLAEDADYRQRLSEGALRISHMFSWEKIAAQTADFYRSLLGKAGRANL